MEDNTIEKSYFKKITKLIEQLTEDFKLDLTGFFSDWEIKDHTIENEQYCLWTSNGYLSFEDYTRSYSETYLPLLTKLRRTLQYKLWLEFKREKIRREFKKREGKDIQSEINFLKNVLELKKKKNSSTSDWKKN